MSVNPAPVELRADGRHASVHHVGGRDDVDPGPRVRDRGPRQQRQRGVVVDATVADHAAVAVRGVLVQADVGHDEESRRCALERADRLLEGPALVPRLASRFVFSLRDSEEDDARYAERLDLLRVGDGLVRREAFDARQGR